MTNLCQALRPTLPMMQLNNTASLNGPSCLSNTILCQTPVKLFEQFKV